MIVGPRGRIHASLAGEEAAAPPPAEKAKKEGEEADKDAKEKEKKPAAPKFQEGYAVARIDLDEVKKHREERQNSPGTAANRLSDSRTQVLASRMAPQ